MPKVEKHKLYQYPTIQQEPPDSGTVIEAHYTKNIKVAKPKVSASEISFILSDKPAFSDSEADLKLKQINNDIFQQLKTERKKHDSSKTFFIGLTALAILGTGIISFLRHIRGK